MQELCATTILFSKQCDSNQNHIRRDENALLLEKKKTTPSFCQLLV